MASGKLLKDYPAAEPIPPDQLLTTACTILVPAALGLVINKTNAARLRCGILAEAANGPTAPDPDDILAARDKFILPDVLGNAGGVSVSYVGWVHDIQQLEWSEPQVNQKLEELTLQAVHHVHHLAQNRSLRIRTAAL